MRRHGGPQRFAALGWTGLRPDLSLHLRKSGKRQTYNICWAMTSNGAPRRVATAEHVRPWVTCRSTATCRGRELPAQRDPSGPLSADVGCSPLRGGCPKRYCSAVRAGSMFVACSGLLLTIAQFSMPDFVRHQKRLVENGDPLASWMMSGTSGSKEGSAAIEKCGTGSTGLDVIRDRLLCQQQTRMETMDCARAGRPHRSRRACCRASSIGSMATPRGVLEMLCPSTPASCKTLSNNYLSQALLA